MSTALEIAYVGLESPDPAALSAYLRDVVGLMPGQAMELVNDHDPVPLHRQFDAEMPARFDWDYLESGPTLWRVRITKRAGSHAAGSCCGACGGA